MKDRQVSARMSELKMAKIERRYAYLGVKYVKNCRRYLNRAIRRMGKHIERECYRDTYGRYPDD